MTNEKIKKPIFIISAVDQDFGIGINNSLPWRIKEDLQFFHEQTTKTKDQTKQNAVIMGRKTWESLPEKFRPLPNRKNIILSRSSNAKLPNSASSLEEAFAIAAADDSVENIFIIGGEQIYAQAIELPEITAIYLTKIQAKFACDSFFPVIPKKFSHQTLLKKSSQGDLKYEFWKHEREGS
jgi:dihydrofolate reductase